MSGTENLISLRRLAAGGSPKEFANAVGCSTGCGLLASSTGASEECFDFSELLAQPRLSGISPVMAPGPLLIADNGVRSL